MTQSASKLTPIAATIPRARGIPRPNPISLRQSLLKSTRCTSNAAANVAAAT